MTRKRRTRGWFLRQTVTYVAAMATFVYVMSPVIWLFISSLETEEALASIPAVLLPGPDKVTINHYYFVLTGFFPSGAMESLEVVRTIMGLQIMPTLVNSLIIATSVTALSLLLGIGAAYSFARIRFAASRKLFVGMIATRLLPYISMAIPMYLIMKTLTLLDTLLGLILVYTVLTMPFTVWLLATYFRGLPQSYEEAAALDGCSRFQILRRVVLPLARSGLIAVGIFAFMEAFGEFIFALVLTQTVASKTLPVTLASMSAEILWTGRGVLMASTAIALLPPILMSVIFRKYVIEGLTSQYVVESR